MTRERDTFGQEERQKQLNVGWGGGGKCGRWRGGAGGCGGCIRVAGNRARQFADLKVQGSHSLKSTLLGSVLQLTPQVWSWPGTGHFQRPRDAAVAWDQVWEPPSSEAWEEPSGWRVCRSESLNRLLPFSSAASQWQFQDCSYKGYACVTEMNAVYTNSSVKIDRYPHALHLFIISTYFFIVCVHIYVSENIWESVLFIHLVGSRDLAEVMRLGGQVTTPTEAPH